MKKQMMLMIFAVMTAMVISIFADTNQPTIYIAGDYAAQKYYSAEYPKIGWGPMFRICSRVKWKSDC